MRGGPINDAIMEDAGAGGSHAETEMMPCLSLSSHLCLWQEALLNHVPIKTTSRQSHKGITK